MGSHTSPLLPPAQPSLLPSPPRRQLKSSPKSFLHMRRRDITPGLSTMDSQIMAQKPALSTATLTKTSQKSTSTSNSNTGSRLSSWSTKDDEILIQARAEGLNWNQIAPKHFPTKTPDACRRRHGRLIERQNLIEQQNAEQWDGVQLDVLAGAYMEVRRDMWSRLASRVGEKWQLVERKCMEAGLKTLAQAYRSAQKKQADDTYHDHEDSGLGIDDLNQNEEEDEHKDLKDLPYSRVPSLIPMLHPSTIPTNNKFDSPTTPKTPIAQSTSTKSREDGSDDSSQTISNDNPMSQSLTDDTDSYSAIHIDETASSLPELRLQKDLILDRLMLYFYEVFDTINSSHRKHYGTTETSSNHSRRSDSKSTSSQGKNKRKSTDGQDENRDDEAADGSRKRPRRDDDPGGQSQTETERRGFACPYFKHNPQKYRNHRSCRGPIGWDTIPRLKEHLYRQHTLPPQCPRCCEAFKDEARLKDHQRSSDACPVREQEPLEGLDKSQVDQLKNRKIMFRAGSEEEKWKIIYLVIFPDTAPNGLPSPYYDDKTAADEIIEDSPKPPVLAQYEAYMNRELPRRVRKELEIAIEKWTGPIEETLKNDLENLIRNCQERLSREFLQCRLPAAEEPQLQPTYQTPVHQTAIADWHSQQAITTETSAYPQSSELSSSDALAQYAVPPETSLGPWPFSWPSSDFCQTAFSDSGYFSNSSAALPSDPWWAPPASVPGSVQCAAILSGQDELPSRVDLETSRPHTTKGKGRANDNTTVTEWNSSSFT